MTFIKNLLPFLCIPIAGLSVFFMVETPKVPPWQILMYTLVITLPCFLILFWKPFDLFFGFAPHRAKAEDLGHSVTPWIGWILLTAMILLNHFARPPADF
ncbi:MAG: hypothetical protein VX438_00290 [Planctomycetota bacterium]|jgi:magnesium-transporting ATPase (P-type)|nr:hypothetical protein [Planctomycetota bacterium]